MLVVLMTMVGSLTVLPALLGGARRQSREGLDQAPWQELRSSSRVWSALLVPVLRFPRAAVVLTSAALVLTRAAAAGHAHESFLSAGDIPRDLSIRSTYSEIQRAFPGAPQPAAVVVRAPDVTAPAVRARAGPQWSGGRSRAARRASRSRR